MDPAIVGDAFYSKLFSGQPAIRRMFPKDMNAQYKKLMDMLSTIVMRLDNFDKISADIEAMGLRHASYNVKPSQYALVGEALLWTLEKGLGNGWNEEVKEAWTTCYNALAEIMINASSNK